MSKDPQPPISPKEPKREYGSTDYDYDDAKDSGKIHRPLVGGNWVAHYEWKVEYAKERLKSKYTPYRLKSLQWALLNLELARRGYWLERKLRWQNITYRLHKIGSDKS